MSDKTLDNIMDEMTSLISILIAKFFRIKFETQQKKKISRIYLDSLMIIDSAGEELITMSDLGKRLDMSKPNVTKLIDKLIDIKFVDRISNDKDRRVIFIKLTDEGKSFLKEFKKEFKLQLKEKLKGLDAKSLSMIKEIIKITKKLIN